MKDLSSLAKEPATTPKIPALEFDGMFYLAYLRNENKARSFLTKQTIAAFNVDKEPWGTYAIINQHNEASEEHGPTWQEGVIRFKSPLVLPSVNWKINLSQQHGGLKGKALSKKLMDEGIDLILTYDKYGWGEIVALDNALVFQRDPRKRVFHGSNQAFDAFDENQRGRATGQKSAKDAFFFTSCPIVAHDYALHASKRTINGALDHERKGEELRIKAEKLEERASKTGLSKDWSLAEQAYMDFEEHELNAIREEEGTGACIYPATIKTGRMLVIPWEEYQQEMLQKGLAYYTEKAKQAGFDCVVFAQSEDNPGVLDHKGEPVRSDHYAIFDQERITTAIGKKWPPKPDAENSAETEQQAKKKPKTPTI